MKQFMWILIVAMTFFSCDETDYEFVGESGTFIDKRDGEEYKWVRIGDQIWMAENLAYLPKISPPSDGSDTKPYYYVYDYEGTDLYAAKATDNYKTYGVLYNWQAALNAPPRGWHLPTDEEWEQLAEYISNHNDDCGKLYVEGISPRDEWYGVGKHLKSKGTIENGDGLWKKPYDLFVGYVEGTDDYGFSALPGGRRHGNKGFSYISERGSWWSATEAHDDYVWNRTITFSLDRLDHRFDDKGNAISVRCVRD